MNPPPLDLHSSGSTNTIMQGRPSPYASCSSTGTISKTELAAMTPTPTPRYTVQPSSGMQARSSTRRSRNVPHCRLGSTAWRTICVAVREPEPRQCAPSQMP
eukprot:CAMPEP_0169477010 /NCGR_PEP_ID=MMETSP1042-20121227/27682_1 /TAXON_ID=464988 /ORGANISM="Hemiselmis andersenii, Strain CCMP1180" /LENGTH=101 /DNA_ID=CAMNT_0009591319 /DNA_START=441 /DNA_END=746 /DNA_ORIENTATION=+